MSRPARILLASALLLTACGTAAQREQDANRHRLLMADQTAKTCAAEVQAHPDVAPYLRRVIGPDGSMASAEQMAETAVPTPEEARAAGAFGRAIWRCDVLITQSMRTVSIQLGQIASNMSEDRRLLIGAWERRELSWGQGLHRLAAQQAAGRESMVQAALQQQAEFDVAHKQERDEQRRQAGRVALGTAAVVGAALVGYAAAQAAAPRPRHPTVCHTNRVGHGLNTVCN